MSWYSCKTTLRNLLLSLLLVHFVRAQSCSGRALQLDGSSWLDAGSPSPWNLPQVYTLEGWIYPTATTDYTGVFGNIWDTGSTESGIGFQLLDGGVVFLHRAPFDNSFLAPSIPLNQWTHIAGTYNAATGEAAIYVNGQQVATRSGGGHQVNYANPRNFMIGRFVDDNEDIRFVGSIAEVRLWNIVRSPADIAQSWNTPIAPPNSQPNLVAYWSMTQLTSGEVTDLTGHGHDASLSGMATFPSYPCSANECSSYFTCVPPRSAPNGRLLPDITLDAARLQASMEIIAREFDSTSCAVHEGCVEGTGLRTLLRFETATPNRGTADLVMGNPENDPRFHYDDCHRHYHYEGYARYLIYDMNNNLVGRGRKMSYCLLDSELDAGYSGPGPVRGSSLYSCSNQGISVGWQDVYHKNLDCQWIDITSIPPGNYYMNIELNVDRLFEELDYSNNAFNISFTVDQPCLPKPHYAAVTPASSSYAYEDPVANGHTAISPTDDGTFSVDLGWSYTYMCNSYSTVWVNSNGFLSWRPESGSATAHEETTPNVPYPNSICVLWSDHDPTRCGQVYYTVTGPVGARKLVVTWYQVCHYRGALIDQMTFQVQLFENDPNVVMFYPDTTTTADSLSNGARATVGLGAVLPSDNIVYSYHASPPIMDEASLVFQPLMQTTSDPPVAMLNGPYQGFVNMPITFDSSGSYGSGPILEYLWIFGDNSVAETSAFPSHIYTSPGEYTITLSVRDGIQSSELATTTAVISDHPCCRTCLGGSGSTVLTL